MDTSKTIEIQTHTVHYTRRGEGPCVIPVHGYGTTSYIWNAIAPLLENHLTLLIPDLPGSGISEVQPHVSIESMADMLHDILLRENIKQCIVIGHSMGGYIAMQFAKKYPSMLMGLGLLHSHVFADTDEKKMARKKSAEFIEQHGTEKYLKEYVKGLFAEHAAPQLVDTHLQMIWSTPAEGLIAHLMAMAQREDTSGVLRNLYIPVFLGLGEADSIMPKEMLLKQAALPHISQIELFAHSGHMSMLEQPVELAHAIKTFVKLCTQTR